MAKILDLSSHTKHRAMGLLTKWLRLESETMVAKMQMLASAPGVTKIAIDAMIELSKGCVIEIRIRPIDPKDTENYFQHSCYHYSGEDRDEENPF